MSVEQLQWKKFPVLDDGFVCLVDSMGNDYSIAQAARVSYGKDEREPVLDQCHHCTSKSVKSEGFLLNCTDCGYISDTRDLSASDRGLIRYLMRHRHTTPFEMAEVKLLVRVPMDCWRQWIRHRTANVNEYSTRYTEAIDSQQTTKPDEWRLQSSNNKQGSSGYVPEGVGNKLSIEEDKIHQIIKGAYKERLMCGVAKEQARKDLPLSTYTEAYWKCDLHNIFHFLSLRMDSHAQLEIRQYAKTIGEEIIKPLFPIAWQAFEDYRLNGMFLTALDIEAIRTESFDHFTNKREKDECVAKIERLKTT